MDKPSPEERRRRLEASAASTRELQETLDRVSCYTVEGREEARSPCCFVRVRRRARSCACGRGRRVRASAGTHELDRPRLARARRRLRAAGRDHGRLERRLPRTDARAGCRHRLLRPQLQEPRRHPDRAVRHGDGPHEGEQPLQHRVPADRVRHAVDGGERAVRCRARDAVVGLEHAVPQERPALPADGRRTRCAAVPARQLEAVHRRRRRCVVAAGRRGGGRRPRDVRQRQERLRSRPARRQPDAAPGAAERPRRLPRDRDPGRAARRHARLPDDEGDGRSRGPEAGAGLVRGREMAGARGTADLEGAAHRQHLVVGLGPVESRRARPGQGRSRLRLAVDARAGALRRSRGGRPGLERVADARTDPLAGRRQVQGRLREDHRRGGREPRAGLGDELRRAAIAPTLRARTPTASEIETFYESYPDLLVRQVTATPAPEWLGGATKGLALDLIAPAAIFDGATNTTRTLETIGGTYTVKPVGDARPLGTMPLAVVAPAIKAALTTFARGAAYEDWIVGRQKYALNLTTCRADDLPQPSPVELESFLPFLSAVG